MTGRVMVVEDERIVAFNLQQRLSRLGYDVPCVAASGAEALRMAAESHPDVVLMDIRIAGDIDGIETAARLNAVAPTPVVYLTAHAEDATIERARATQPYGYLIKPFSEREMHATLQMALERRKFESALRASEDRLRLALDAAGMGVIDVDREAGGATLDAHTARILGLPERRARASCAVLLACVDAVDREQAMTVLERSLAELEQCRIEFRRTDALGVERWFRLEGRGREGEQGAGRRLLGVLRDITDARRAEQMLVGMNEHLERRVAARTAELQQHLAELDAFSYSIAHDLKAPVRAIVGFSELLMESHGGALDDEGRRFLSRTRAAGLRMNAMIDALLSLAHLSRMPMRVEAVDLSALARDIVDQLRAEDPGRDVECVIASDLVVRGDAAMLRVALDNLLRNAWKFTSGHPRATIEFGSRAHGRGREYFVRDDGAGFDAGNAPRLFGAFQRMHPASAFPGTGIGLATVRRIVNRHRGEIRAESAVEHGATFRFTLGDLDRDPRDAA